MMSGVPEEKQLRVALISLHGLIRAESPELGRDADTGGQVRYVLELAAELARLPQIRRVELITRQIIDDRIDVSYGRLEEPITPGASIVRIPFGPKRYLKKEALWPYLDGCVDQTLAYFKRTGVPDIIHAHYADAGYVGAQLARLLAIPFIFTGHSLGRVKRQHMLISGKTEEELESRYRFTTRVEAEEMALETASMVVASTNQEVEQQYAIYEHYVPDRMEVMPPGVDLTAYFPPQANDPPPKIAADIGRFLREPQRPMIFTMARPDERKNLEMLVRVYGQSQELQSIANLVMVLGARDDLRELGSAQRRVLQNILTLIDVYDLYGKVAYPKHHTSEDVPQLYRWATQLRGVFINPALTEPFGLTLLEAAASGLPVVATHDGGPQDIVANCQNGLLADPLDPAALERALLRVLTEADSWNKWSEQGIQGVHRHYTWRSHAERYMRDIGEILEHADTPTLRKPNAARRLPEFDRLVITDLDNTLTGDPDGLREFVERMREATHVGFGIATGRAVDDAMPLIRELGLPSPDVLVTSVGTELYYGPHLHLDRTWRKQIPFHWNRRNVEEVLAEIPGLFIQAHKEQSEFKISYQIDPEVAPSLGRIRRLLRQAGLRTKVILSLGIYLDVIPLRGGSDLAIRHLLYKWGFSPEHLLVAGDSGNDEGMLRGRTLGVVVGNHGPELQKLRGMPRIYFASAENARGILEGIDYYNFFGHITIPNDRTS